VDAEELQRADDDEVNREELVAKIGFHGVPGRIMEDNGLDEQSFEEPMDVSARARSALECGGLPCTLHACRCLPAEMEEPEGEVVEAAQAEAEALCAGWAVAVAAEVVAELGQAAGGLGQGQVGRALLGREFFLNFRQRTSSSVSV
jgi:hypothetical protein